MKTLATLLVLFVGLFPRSAHSSSFTVATGGMYLSSYISTPEQYNYEVAELNNNSYASRGNPATNPNALEFPPYEEFGKGNTINAIPANKILYGVGWEGNLDPQGAFATQQGKVIKLLLQIKSTTGTKFKLADVNGSVFATDVDGNNVRPELTYNFSNLAYGPGIEGWNPGPDNKLGTADDVKVTDPNTPASMIRITSLSYGVDIRQFPGSTLAEQRNAALAYVYKGAPYQLNFLFNYLERDATTDRVLYDAGGSFINVLIKPSTLTVPEPSVWALLFVGSLLPLLLRRKRIC